MFLSWVYILVFYCCLTNYHKLPGLKQHLSILSVSIDQKFGHSFAHLGSLLGQSCYYVTTITKFSLGDAEDYTRVLGYSGNRKRDFIWLHFRVGTLKGVLSLFTSLRKRSCFCSSSSKFWSFRKPLGRVGNNTRNI